MSPHILILAAAIKVALPAFTVDHAPGPLSMRLPDFYAKAMGAAQCGTGIPAENMGQEAAVEFAKCGDRSSCYADVGRLIGADVVIAGSVQKLDEAFLITLNIVDVKTSRLRVRQEVRYEGKANGIEREVKSHIPELCKAVNPEWTTAPAEDLLAQLSFDDGSGLKPQAAPAPAAPGKPADDPADFVLPPLDEEPGAKPAAPAPAPAPAATAQATPAKPAEPAVPPAAAPAPAAAPDADPFALLLPEMPPDTPAPSPKVEAKVEPPKPVEPAVVPPPAAAPPVIALELPKPVEPPKAETPKPVEAPMPVEAPKPAEAPVAEAPKPALPPVAEVPKAVEAPKPVEAPVVAAAKPVEAPVAEVPKPVEAPIVAAPKPVETPVVEAPKPVETPLVEAPKPVETPKVDAGKTAVADATKPPPFDRTIKPRAPSRPLPWTLIAAGGTLVVGAVGIGLGAKSSSIWSGDQTVTQSGITRHSITHAQANTANSLAFGANVLLSVAGAGLIGTGALFYFNGLGLGGHF